MENRTIYPVFHLLVVNHDPRLREESHEAVLNSKFNSRGAAVIRTTCTPQIQRGAIRLKLPNMLDNARHGNSGCATGSHKRVIDIDVNDHRPDEANGLG
jgi:hypothetical protein